MSFDFNIEDVQVAAAQTQRASVPDGEYLVVITEANKDFVSQKNMKPGLKMEYEIQTGPHDGKKVEEVLFYANEGLVRNKVGQIAVAIGMTGGFTAKDVEKLPGKRMIVTLQTKPDKNDPSKMYQNVNSYAAPNAQAEPAALPWKR